MSELMPTCRGFSLLQRYFIFRSWIDIEEFKTIIEAVCFAELVLSTKGIHDCTGRSIITRQKNTGENQTPHTFRSHTLSKSGYGYKSSVDVIVFKVILQKLNYCYFYC